MINLEQIGPTRVAADLAKGGAKITVLSREAGFQISGVLPTRQAAEPIVRWRISSKLNNDNLVIIL
jgi:hypothetical protein